MTWFQDGSIQGHNIDISGGGDNHTYYVSAGWNDENGIVDYNWKKAINYDGFSDHTLGIIAPIIFSILKKRNNAKKIIIEKHVKLKNSKGPDASSSIDTDELKQLTYHIRNIENMKF